MLARLPEAIKGPRTWSRQLTCCTPAAGGEVCGPAGPSSGLAALEAGLERARRANKPLVLCAMPGVVWEVSSGLDPALLGALAGEVLLQEARPRLVLPGQQQAGAACGAAGAVTPTAAGALQGAAG